MPNLLADTLAAAMDEAASLWMKATSLSSGSSPRCGRQRRKPSKTEVAKPSGDGGRTAPSGPAPESSEGAAPSGAAPSKRSRCQASGPESSEHKRSSGKKTGALLQEGAELPARALAIEEQKPRGVREPWSPFASLAEYPVLARLRTRILELEKEVLQEATLASTVNHGKKAESLEALRRFNARAERLIHAAASGSSLQFGQSFRSEREDGEEEVDEKKQAPLSIAGSSRTTRRRLRVVCVSDTHMYHDRLMLPEGDVLIHCGDLVANYGKEGASGLLHHLDSACIWLAAQARRFQLVVFVAGNHETILDGEYYDDEPAKELLRTRLPANVVYLENELLEWRGLRLWGSPVVVSRRELLNKRYVSDGFERSEETRRKLWEQIPEGLDVLITHSPPQNKLLSGSLVSCKALRSRLDSLNQPPRFHVFGHDHDYPGIEDKGRGTVFVNSAQKGLLKMDPDLGGAPWVFDIVVDS